MDDHPNTTENHSIGQVIERKGDISTGKELTPSFDA
jgi:hypothetical protein